MLYVELTSVKPMQQCSFVLFVKYICCYPEAGPVVAAVIIVVLLLVVAAVVMIVIVMVLLRSVHDCVKL